MAAKSYGRQGNTVLKPHHVLGTAIERWGTEFSPFVAFYIPCYSQVPSHCQVDSESFQDDDPPVTFCTAVEHSTMAPLYYCVKQLNGHPRQCCSQGDLF